MTITKSIFEGREEEVFTLQGDGDLTVELVLTKVDSPNERILQQARDQGVREPFSLLFHGPKQTFINQHMYTLQHNDMGLIEVFLVPVNQDEKGFYYEAVFG